MNVESASALKVIYNLRPAKQIERRMLIDAFQILAQGGFGIRDYQYTGMGSLYFVDYVLFHRLLGIRDMLSVEMDSSLETRIRFNKPFGLVNVEICTIGDVIPTLGETKQHILWLDYDFRMNRLVVEDVQSAAFRLTPGSVLLATVDVKPPVGSGPADWRRYYQSQAGDFFDLEWSDREFAESELPRTSARILYNAIRAGLRAGVQFRPLFSFLYADGHPMLTVGGMLVTAPEAATLDRCDFSQADYIRGDLALPPYEIIVPRLTHKERMYVDRFMPCVEDWEPADFIMSPEDILNYRRIYRFYPSYAELLV